MKPHKTSPFALAMRSKTGKAGILLCFFCTLLVIVLVSFSEIYSFTIPLFLLIAPGFGSVIGMQMFANEANRIRLEQERSKE